MADYTWTGGGSGESWSDPDDWMPPDDDLTGTTPGGGDTATFSDDATITDSGTAADIEVYASLNVDGGDVTAIDNFLVSGPLSVDDGSIGAGSLTVDDSVDLDDATATIDNFVTIDDSGSITLKSGSTLDSDDITAHGSVDLDDATATIDDFVTIDDSGSITLKSGSTLDSDDITAHGSVDVDDGTVTTTNFFYLEGGELTIEEKGEVDTTSQADTTSPLAVEGGGSIDVDGSGATLDSEGPGGVVIGLTGAGSLTIEDGGVASFTSDTNFATLGIGYLGGDGTVTVEGSGSKLTTTGSAVQVDSDAGSQGELDIEDGATADFSTSDGGDPLVVGQGGHGTLLLEGSGSQLTASGGDSVIGLASGTGEFDIEDGATANISNPDPDASALIVGSDANGTLKIDGTGSSLTSSGGGLTIGNYGGVGDLEISAGATVSASEADPENDSTIEIGYGGTGTATVEGSGSLLESTSGNGFVGATAGGDGTLTIESGASAVFTTTPDIYSFFIGSDGGATGTVIVEGSNSKLTTNGGGVGVGLPDSTGKLTIEDGATATFDVTGDITALVIGGSNATGTVIVDGSGSSLAVSGAVDAGLDGTGYLTISDGADFTSSYSQGASVDIGVDSGSNGTMTVTGAATSVTLDQGEGIVVGDAGMGLLQVEGGASFEAEANDPTSNWAVQIGAQDTGDGEVDVDGANTQLIVGDGGMVVGDSGIGSATVSDGAELDITDAADGLRIGNADNSSGDVVVTGSNSTLDTLGPLIVGDDGGGHLTIADGGEVDAEDDSYGVVIANFEDSTSDLVLTGSSSALVSFGPFWVGDDGTGSFTIDDSATFTSNYSGGASVDIGVGSTGDGTVTVSNSGTDVTLDQGEGVVVGDAGKGLLEVDDGATLTASANDSDTSYAVVLGASTGGDGRLTLSGSGSTLTANDGGMAVGAVGDGHATIDDGATLNVTDSTFGLVVGAEDDSTGDITVSAKNSLLDSTGPVIIGLGGAGTMMVDDGATLRVESDGYVIIGSEQDSNGSLTLDGDDTTFDYDGELTVGDSGDGTFTLQNGASWESQDNVIAANDDDSSGAIKVTGKESSLTAGGDLTLGVDGDATLDVDDGGSLTVRGEAVEAEDDNATATTTIDGKDTKVTYEKDDVIGSAGKADDTISGSASAEIDGGGDLTLGEKDGGSGKLTITGQDSSFDAGDGNVTIGSEGTGEIDVLDGGELSSGGSITLGDEDGSSGSLLVDGQDSSVDPADVTVGGSGAGDVTLSNGGSLETNDLKIADEDGSSGNVTVADKDSSLTVDGELEVGGAGQGVLLVDGDSSVSGTTKIGAEDGGTGQVTVNVATLSLDDATTVGEEGSGSLLVQQEGTLKAKDVTLGEGSGSDGTLTVSGDQTNATVDALTVGGSGQGTLIVDDSGSLTSNDDATLGDAASANIQTATVESDGNWTLDDGLTVGDAGIATLTITSGGAVSATGDITLGDQGAATGEIDVSGVSSSAGAMASSLTYGGTLTVGGSGKGTLDISDGAQVSPNAGGKGEIDIAGETGGLGGAVSVNGSGSELEGDTLAVGGTATAAGGSGTLDIADGGVASTTDAIIWSGGKVTLAGGDLAASSVALSAGGAVSGYGDLGGTIASGSAGSVTASGGELLLSGAVDAVATSFVIDGVAAGSDLAFSGKVASAPTITFGAGPNYGALDLTGEGSGSTFMQNFDGVISGFAGKGDTPSTSDVIEVTASGAGDKAVWTQTNPGVSGTLQIETAGGGALDSLTLDGAYTNGQFNVSDVSGVDQITYAACYRRGTRILTDRGEAPIEALRVGDLAVTASGALRQIIWIGHRFIDIRRHPDPAVVQPMRVSAGAFGEGLPRRDLWLSPGHNVGSEGALMPISALVNGLSVTQIDVESVEYWHVELDAHDVLLAEGLPAESYLDTGNRAAFANGGAFIEAHPDFQPKHWAETCLPLVQDGPCVARTKQRLLTRLVEQGHRLTREAEPHVLVDGARVEPIALSKTRLAFALPAGGREIVLRSHVFVPAQTSATSFDPRALGLCIGRLLVDGAALALHSDEACASGWRAAERSDGRFLHRWTTGATPLPAGARIVVVELAGAGHYWRRPSSSELERRANIAG